MSKKRGGRRGRSRLGDHEYFYKRYVHVRCPIEPDHELGLIYQDSGRTAVYPEQLAQAVSFVDGRRDESNGPAEVPIRRDGDRIRASCPRCARRGIRTDFQVRWERIEALLDRMSDSGPGTLHVLLDAEAIAAAAQPTR